jgi:hypothetical protein
MRLIDDVRGALTHYSTKALALGAAIPGVWAAIPDDLKAALPPTAIHWVANITGIVCAFGLAGKFIDQTPKDQA